MGLVKSSEAKSFTPETGMVRQVLFTSVFGTTGRVRGWRLVENGNIWVQQ